MKPERRVVILVLLLLTLMGCGRQLPLLTYPKPARSETATETPRSSVTSTTQPEPTAMRTELTAARTEPTVTRTEAATSTAPPVQTTARTVAPPETTAQTAASTQSFPNEATRSYWDGDWYGYWIASNATGAYKDNMDYWWPMCGRIAVDNGGNVKMTLWDTASSASEPWSVVTFDLVMTGALNPHGRLVARSGHFSSQPIDPGQWIIDPGEWEVENFLVAFGTFKDEYGTYQYSLYIRPWGHRWDDLISGNPEVMPENYHSWYLPLIEAKKPMPDVIDEPGAVG